MSSNEKVINYKVVVLIEIYDLVFCHFTIHSRLIGLNFNLWELEVYY